MDFFFQGFSTLQIVVLCISCSDLGINKTGMPGLGLLPVVMLANTFEPGLSTGLQLMMIAMADIPAIIYYRKTVNWKIILRLLPQLWQGSASGDRAPFCQRCESEHPDRRDRSRLMRLYDAEGFHLARCDESSDALELRRIFRSPCRIYDAGRQCGGADHGDLPDRHADSTKKRNIWEPPHGISSC